MPGDTLKGRRCKRPVSNLVSLRSLRVTASDSSRVTCERLARPRRLSCALWADVLAIASYGWA
eukprot:14785917-Alexandrium_andersonii.AAC.1